MSVEIQESQDDFLRRGGCYQIGLAYLRKAGLIPAAGKTPFHEYPKMLRFSKGFKEVAKSTVTCDKETVRWTENVEQFEEIIVHDEAEEERLLAGGKTSAQIEEDRQNLIRKCAAAGVSVDPSWTAVRLRRELGETMDAPVADEMAELKAKLKRLEEMAEMRRKIAALEAEIAAPKLVDDAETLRAELIALNVIPDKRWGAARLREELDRATAPESAA